MNHTADELVDGLTCKQCHDCLRLFMRAIEHHDRTMDHAWLAREMMRIVEEVQQMAVKA